MARKKPPPPELEPEAIAICDVMGWGYETEDRLDGGRLARGVLRDLRKAGWGLFSIPGDYE